MTNKQVTNRLARPPRPEPTVTNSRYTPKMFKSPLDMPEVACGKVRIRHRIVPAGETVPVVGMRQAITRGIRAASYQTKEPLRIHELVHEDHGCWMTDSPEELNQIGEMLHDVDPSGRVLVGGLGLGILAKTLSERPGVDQVTVVEIDPDVVALCTQPGYEVITGDILSYLRRSNQRYDYYILDTWQATNESAWWSQVMPQRRAIRRRWGAEPTIHCWAEDIMRGQIMWSLTAKQPHWYYTGLAMPMSERRARSFLDDVGLPAWEEMYGATVDANLRKERRS